LAVTGTPRDWEAHLDHELRRLEGEGLLRSLVPVERAEPPYVVRNGRRLVSFASNDYLGLASHPRLAEAAAASLPRGSGATASRLISGGDLHYTELEGRIARFQLTEAALVFGSGYLANVGVIAALAGRGDAIFADKLNHASAVDGGRLSGATLFRYPHLDMDALESMLAEAGRRSGGRKLIVTETLFGMNGDLAQLERLVELKQRYGAALMVDEAHAVGVFGPRGEGYAYELGLESAIDLHMGTFGKAFGCYGAYVAGSSLWIRYLVNKTRPFVYSTALPPPVIGAIGAALKLVESASEQRLRIRAMADRLRGGLDAAGLPYDGSGSHIVPVVIGAAAAAVEASRRLEEHEVLAPAIRPPTVPAGKACLRFSITSAHGSHHIDLAVRALCETLGEKGPQGR
jgi:8-amino-7-oxononanoate synthase